MSSLQPADVKVTFLPPATSFSPVEQRMYTMTHSKDTDEMLVSIGCHVHQAAIHEAMRDEVTAEWLPRTGQYTLWGKVYVSGGEYDEKYSQVRYLVFQRELPKALRAIMYADRTFFTYFPWLLDAPIYVQFESIYPAFQSILYMGTPRKYLTSDSGKPEKDRRVSH
ncbi:staygreen family protein [Bacillus fonticola]|uniref:staygreen family protein n=1 Tax=Bacillus fonticola TaxID=2728853 RepID=UPI001472D63B|nr:staygreen family protein [Bacillus fonticola]